MKDFHANYFPTHYILILLETFKVPISFEANSFKQVVFLSLWILVEASPELAKY
jgi:hypothetical protein